MAQHIDKSALVAEIEKVIDEPAPSHDQQCTWEDGYYCGLYKAESIINTLEVKEMEKPTASDRGMVEEIIINLKRVEQDYRIDLTNEMEWLRNKAQKGE